MNCSHLIKDSFFCVKDNVSHTLSYFSVATSRGAFVRSVLPMIRVPLKDVEPCEVLGFDCSDGQFELNTFNWDCYKYPESKMESLAPLNLSEDEKKEIEKSENK